MFDLDSLQLIALARVLESGRYLSGRAIGPAPHFVLGAVENPGTPPFDVRVRRAAKKALAGARFLQLQICYRPELLERFMRAAHDTGLSERVALIPSICILRTVGGMRFVATKVPGIDVPPEIVRRVEQAQGRRAGVLRDRLRAGDARARAAGRRRPSLHLVPQGRGHREAVRTPGHSAPSSKGKPMDTVLRSRSKTVTIGAEQPFCIIGERINPTGRKAFAEELRGGDLSTVTADALAQVAGRRRHARRQRRDPARRRARAAEVDAARRRRRRSTCRSASTPR